MLPFKVRLDRMGDMQISLNCNIGFCLAQIFHNIFNMNMIETGSVFCDEHSTEYKRERICLTWVRSSVPFESQQFLIEPKNCEMTGCRVILDFWRRMT